MQLGFPQDRLNSKTEPRINQEKATLKPFNKSNLNRLNLWAYPPSPD